MGRYIDPKRGVQFYPRDGWRLASIRKFDNGRVKITNVIRLMKEPRVSDREVVRRLYIVQPLGHRFAVTPRSPKILDNSHLFHEHLGCRAEQLRERLRRDFDFDLL